MNEISVDTKVLSDQTMHLWLYLWLRKVSKSLVFTQNFTKLDEVSCEYKLDVSLTSIHAAENYHIWNLQNYLNYYAFF